MSWLRANCCSDKAIRSHCHLQGRSGRLRLIRHTLWMTRLVILHTARRREFFAEASLFAAAYHCNAVAAAPSSVRVYPKKIVQEAMLTNLALAEAFMARLAGQLQELRARMELRNIRSALERVLQYLRLRAGTGGRSIAVAESQMLLRCEMLIPEKDHLVFEKRPADVGEHGIVERLAQIDPGELGAESSGDAAHVKCPIAHPAGMSRPMLKM